MAIVAFESGSAVTDGVAVPGFGMGLPLSGANPLEAELLRPAMEAEQRQRKAWQDWETKAIGEVDAAVLDWDGFVKRKGSAPNLEFDDDPERARKRGIVTSYLKVANKGKAPADDAEEEVLMGRVAEARFNGKGKGDALAFYGEIEKEATGRKSHRDLMEDLTTGAGAAALAAKVATASSESEALSWPLWLAEARKKPGYNGAREAEYFKAWQGTQATMRKVLAPFGGTLKEAWGEMQGGNLNLAQFYGDLQGKEERDEFLATMAVLAKTLPKEQQAAFWENVTKSTERAGMSMVDNLLEGRFPEIPFFNASGERRRDAEEYERKSMGFDAGPTREERQLAMRNFRIDINKIRDGTFDPVKHLNASNTLLGIAERAAYATPLTLEFMGVALLPGVGTAASLRIGEGFIYEQMRDSMMKSGMSDADSSRVAWEAAPYIAVPYTALEKLGANVLVKKMPLFDKAVQAVTNKLASGAARYGVRALGIAGFETGIENVQDFMPAAVQEVHAALDREVTVKGVVWSNGKDGFLDGYWEHTAVTFGVMLPLAFIGATGGIQRDTRAREFAAASDARLRALGIRPEGVANIRAAAEQGLGSLDATIEAELARRNPLSEDSRAAVEELKEELRAEAEAASAAGAALEADGSWPRIVRSGNTWTLYDQTSGEELGRVGSQAEALEMAAGHMGLNEERDADEIGYLATLLEGEAATAGTDLEGERTVGKLAPGEEMSVAAMAARSEEDERRVMAQVRAREARGEEPGWADIVLGEHRTELRNGVREMTNQLYSGGSLLTVFHEDGHKLLRKAQGKGKLLRPELIALGRALDQVYGGKKTKSGEAMRFLPENEAEITDAMLDEMVAELLESEVLRRRKTGGPYGLPAAVISKNLSALTRLGGGVVKSFMGFVDAFRARFGLAVGRALETRKAIKEGRIKEEQLDEFMAKLFGLEEQDQLDQEAERQAEEILGGEAFEGDPFSLGKSTPARDARALGELVIDGPALEGKREDLRKLVREMITAELQGKTVVNKDTGTEIRFNAESKREAVGKMRKEPGFRAAMQLRPIVEDAVMIGTVAPQKGREADTERFEYFALPVRINGTRQTAWFNVRIVKRGGAAVFYEFGLYGNKEAPATQRLGEQSPAPNASQPEPADTVGGFLEEIKGTLPAAVKVAAEGDSGAAFSLAGSRMVDALRADAVARIKDPVRRVQAMTRLARTMESARLDFERVELSGLTKRAGKSLKKEAAMREAMRWQELENETWARHMAVLTDDDLTKMKAQPGHALLSVPNKPLRGRLMSRTAAMKAHPDLFALHRAGDFEGSENVSRTLFGGTLMPDQAAQEMFDAGLIREATPEAMWKLLESEGRHVAQMRDFLDTAKQELKEGRQQAKDEANAWLAEQERTQADPEQVFSPKQEILRVLGLYQSILMALPAQVRGKLGGYVELARLGSNEARLTFLKAKLQRVDEEMEKYLRTQFGKEFMALLERARPEKEKPGERIRGKIGADVHELFEVLRDAMFLTAGEAEAEAVKLESRVASGELTAEEESHAKLEANLIRLVGDWGKADAARREAAVVEASRVFASGYMLHRIEVSRKREKRAATREALGASTGMEGTPEEIELRDEQDEGTKIGRVKQIPASLRSYEQVVQSIFGLKSKEGDDLVNWERRAANAKADALSNKMDALDALFEDLAGGKFKGTQLRAKLAKRGAIKVTNWRGKTMRFSELQGIAATLMWRQEDGRRHMTGHVDDSGKPLAKSKWHYRQQDIDAIEAKLSPAARALRLHLVEQYAAEYDRLNAIYRQLNGVNLPRHKFYSPLVVVPLVGGSPAMVDPVTGMPMSGGLNPGSLKNRSQTAVARPDFKRDALVTYIAHTRQMEHYIAYAPFATEAQAILNRDLTDAAEAAAGAESVSVLRKWIDYHGAGGNKDAAAFVAFNKVFGNMVGNFAAMALVGRVSVLVIQSIQLGAGLNAMPTGAYLKRFGKLMTGQLDWGKALDSSYIQRRKKQMPVSVQEAMEGLRTVRGNLTPFAIRNRVKYGVRRLGETIAGADALFTAGTFAMVYDYQLGLAKASGLTGSAATAQAVAEAERITDRVAQPVRPGARSYLEVSQTNPFFRILWIFASASRQHGANAALGHADRTPGEKARAWAVWFLVGGVGAALIRAATRDALVPSDDDDWFDERNWDPKRMGLAALTGPFGGAPLFGDAIEGIAFEASGEYMPTGTMLDAGRQGIKAAKKVPLWFTGEREVHGALKDVEAMLTAAGLVSDNAAAATSISHIVKDAFGAVENWAGGD